jgi:tRNA G18 (ribose-2'-O)-methylase SpoU
MTEERDIQPVEDSIRSNFPRMYLVIYNIQSKANVRDLMNTAFAFGCTEVWLVGHTKDDQKSKFISKQFQDVLDEQQIQLVVFPKWINVLEHLTAFPEIALVGVEIDARSHNLNDRDVLPPFASDSEGIAILMGNEGQGIHPKHLEACQGRLIRIPQYGTGTASLNVNVACSIVLYHFHQWKYRMMTEKGDNGVTSSA